MSREPTRVIVNADDLGLSPAVNAAVFAGMGRGEITSATLLANGPAIEEALGEVGRHPDCSFGVHLNLTQFSPLTRDPALAPLLDARGAFSGRILEGGWPDSRCRRAIVHELGAQIDFLRHRSVALSHLDSHQHVHTRPALFGALFALTRRHGLCRLRLSRNLPEPPHRHGFRLRQEKALYNLALRHLLRARTTEGFGNLRAFCAHAAAGGPRFATFEAMVHPGANAEDDRLLASDWRAKLPFEVQLISYREI